VHRAVFERQVNVLEDERHFEAGFVARLPARGEAVAVRMMGEGRDEGQRSVLAHYAKNPALGWTATAGVSTADATCGPSSATRACRADAKHCCLGDGTIAATFDCRASPDDQRSEGLRRGANGCCLKTTCFAR
jgi:hypothetical protein